ncbi:hypothetical protein M408DRAFT_23718 [Serendipita vermifera MAFF 305830]|uniref:Cytochrome P450 n=1 Tax=Serendipita vermifera MAFF 305830 TaxID=933852 RepID=A0A0C3AUS2_SERVB|nr:hypothetical protein M408DRAFT_23718 [Serendipita vermifera MAFF 305830]
MELHELATSPLSLGIIALSVATIGLYKHRSSSTTNYGGYSLPPGPPPDFLIGNLRQLPKHHMSARFTEWARKYGDIVHAQIPGLRFIIVNSYAVAQELLTKRPNTTAGRKNGFMFREIMGLWWTMPNLPPGPKLAEARKMLRRAIGPQRVGHHDPAIEKSAARAMVTLQTVKGGPTTAFFNEVGRLVTTVTYGEEMWRTMGDDLANWNCEQMKYINEAFFNFWPVDIMNFLRFIPSWMPGAYFKKMGDRSKWLSNQVRHIPFLKAQELYSSGVLGHSIAMDLLEEFGATENAQDALAILFLAGAETTSTALSAFCHALYLFPEVAQKVYAEITAVTEGMRLPTTNDRARLPYTEATWKEAFRWNTFMPIQIPHVTSQDEVINGHLIPAGSLVLPNNEAMFTDPGVWGDPESFRPERFLESGADSLPNPLVVIFGYGMRVCPGLYLADRIGFLYSASMAMLFDVLPLEGKTIPDPATVEYADIAMRLPVGFECQFVPRSEKAKQLLNTLALEA